MISMDRLSELFLFSLIIYYLGSNIFMLFTGMGLVPPPLRVLIILFLAATLKLIWPICVRKNK